MADLTALTLWPEWAAAVVHLGKPLENRGPESPRWLRRVVGRRIAIHAGKYIGGRQSPSALVEARDAMCGTAFGAGWALVGGRGWFGVHRTPDVTPDWRFVFAPDREERLLLEEGGADAHGRVVIVPVVRSAIVCTAIVGEPHRPSGRPWEQDDAAGWCWPLLDVRRLPEPVPCSGKQGLWTVPEDADAPHPGGTP